MSKEHLPLKYECLDRFDETLKTCEQENVRDLLIDLRDLIYYQMKQITGQRAEIVSIKHKMSWQQYDKK